MLFRSLADLVASAIAFERRRIRTGVGSPSSAKGKVAARLGVEFGHVGLHDGRSARYNVATYGAKRSKQTTPLRIVPSRSA